MSPRSLPTAAGPAATRTATTEAAKASPTTSAESSEATASTTVTAPASAEDIREENPEEDAAKRREQDDEYNDYDYDNAANRQSPGGLMIWLGGSAGLRTGELDPCVGGNHVGNAARDQ